MSNDYLAPLIFSGLLTVLFNNIEKKLTDLISPDNITITIKFLSNNYFVKICNNFTIVK